MKLQALLLMLSVSNAFSQVINYVRPDDSSPDICPCQPCFTLDHYADQIHESFTSLIFLPGSYNLESSLLLQNITNITLKSENVSDAAKIILGIDGQFKFVYVNHSSIENLTFVISDNALHFDKSWNITVSKCTFLGGVNSFEHILVCNSETVTIVNCYFHIGIDLIHYQNSVGSSEDVMIAISTDESKVTILQCRFVGNQLNDSTEISYKTLVYVDSNSIIDITDSCFEKNSGSYGGAVAVYGKSRITVSGTAFNRNHAIEGGAVYMENSTLILNNNKGTGFWSHSVTNTTCGNCGDANLSPGETVFCKNDAIKGGAICMKKSSLILKNNKNVRFISNSAETKGGGLSIDNSSNTTESESAHDSNRPNVYFASNTCKYGGAIASYLSNITIVGAEFTNNSMYAIYAANSEVNATRVIFRRNKGSSGGAVRAFNSELLFEGTLFRLNTAIKHGGAIFVLYGSITARANVIFEGNKALKGGAFSVRRAKFVCESTLFFKANLARWAGGAMYFSSFSEFILLQHANITSSHNHASKYGGVIYHSDTTDQTQCMYQAKESTSIDENSVEYLLPYCFIELKDVSENESPPFSIVSLNNTAGEAGNILYGGLLDRCQMEFNDGPPYVKPIVPFTFLINKVIHITSTDNSSVKDFSSQPYQLCFCGKNCSEMEQIQTLRGQPFNVTVMALDQGNTTIQSLVTAVLSSSARLTLGQTAQKIMSHCTTLTYTMYSTREKEQLELYSDGPCCNSGLAKVAIQVALLPCPYGFTLSGGQCICEERLQVYEVECTIDQEVYMKRKAGTNVWISFLIANESYEGLILCSFCPTDYCTQTTIYFTLDNFNAQCEENRGGLLCGACTTNHSLLLGSNVCQRCSNTYLFLIILFATAGIVLVVFLSSLRLTVATGMINSILLYANIVQANRTALFPGKSTSVLTVFIAWMNVDLGFQTCFYNGMDAYAQTWLQFAFPLYIWVLISLIIITSRYSITMSKLIGHNPIAVLATLLLMSYAKILKIIIEVYSSVDLDYPGNKTVAVWLKDANVPYLQSKHLILTITTTLFLVFFFFPYTFLVLLGYKLYPFSGRKYFGWLRRVKPFLDSYYAPYEAHTRYWTGFLLIIRIVLYTVFSFSSLGGKSKSLTTNITFTSLIVIAWLSIKIYNRFCNNVIEASIYLNLIALSVVSAAVPELVNTLVGIVFVTMLGIIVYHFHILYTAKTSLWLKSKDKLHKYILAVKGNTQESTVSSLGSHNIVTKTVINIREPLLEMESNF